MIKAFLLLLLAIIMTSCGLQTDVTQIAETTADSTVTSSVDSFFMIEGELPDIGAFSGKTQGHFYAEYTPDFIPSEEYGEILPYIGNYKIYTKNDGEPAQSAYGIYGFCTTDGRIVMDASKKTAFIYYQETQDGFGYYRVSRGMVQLEDTPDEVYPTETLIIPRSGAWCLTLTENDSFSAIGNGVLGIHVTAEGGYIEKTVLYDYDSNELFSIADAMSVSKLSHGLMAVMQWDSSSADTYYNYMDLQGNVVLGPYSRASDFNEYGIARVTDLDGEVYLIDTDGDRLTEKQYSSIDTHYSNDRERQIFTAQYASDEAIRDVFDAKGNLIGSMNGQYISVRLPKNGEVIYYAYDGISDGIMWKRLSDGSDFVSLTYDVSADPYSGASQDDVFIHRDEEKKSAILFDGDGETIAVLEDFGGWMDISEDRRYLTYSSSRGEGGTEKLYVYDTETGTNVFTIDAEGYASFAGKEDRYVRFALYNSTEFYDQTNTYFLYDTQTDSVVFADCMWIAELDFGDKVYFHVCTENSFTLYDEELHVIRRCYNE